MYFKNYKNDIKNIVKVITNTVETALSFSKEEEKLPVCFNGILKNFPYGYELKINILDDSFSYQLDILNWFCFNYIASKHWNLMRDNEHDFLSAKAAQFIAGNSNNIVKSVNYSYRKDNFAAMAYYAFVQDIIDELSNIYPQIKFINVTNRER